MSVPVAVASAIVDEGLARRFRPRPQTSPAPRGTHPPAREAGGMPRNGTVSSAAVVKSPPGR